MKTLLTASLMALMLLLGTATIIACTPAQLQKAEATQANIDATATAVQTHIDKAAPVIQADIVKATPAINTAVDIGLAITGNGAVIPINDAAAAIIEKGQAAAASKTTPAATTSP